MLDRTSSSHGPIAASDVAPFQDAEITVLPAAARVAFRASDDDAIARAGAAFGVALPREVCRAAVDGERAALWLGPDEWMLVATNENGADVVAALESALGDRPCSVVDVSDRSLALAIEGVEVEAVLASACPLDLALAAFPVGMCTRTVLAKSEITLRRTSETTFVIDVWRSFAPYVRGVLEEARREHR